MKPKATEDPDFCTAYSRITQESLKKRFAKGPTKKLIFHDFIKKICTVYTPHNKIFTARNVGFLCAGLELKHNAEWANVLRIQVNFKFSFHGFDLRILGSIPASMGSIPASSNTVESEGRQMMQCWIEYIKNNKTVKFSFCLQYGSMRGRIRISNTTKRRRELNLFNITIKKQTFGRSI